MTSKQRELVEAIKAEFKSLPFKERMNLIADSTTNVVDPYLRLHPEKEDEIEELQDLEVDTILSLEADACEESEDYWTDKVCAAELKLYNAFMDDEEGDITEEDCELAGATLNDYMDWVRAASGCGFRAEDCDDYED